MALTRAVSDFKDSVKAATTTNITLAGGAPTTVDGISISANDSILVRSQTDATQNGLYRVTTLGTGSNGTWTRRSDFNASNQVSAGALIFVEQGSINGNIFYYLPGGLGTVTIGSTSLNFSNLYTTIGGDINANIAALLPTYQGALTANLFTGVAVYAGTIGNTGATLTGSTFNATGAVTGNTFTGIAVYGGTIGNTGSTLTGTLSTTAQTNITSLGTLTSLGVTGTSTLGVVTAASVSAGTIGNTGAAHTGSTFTATGAVTGNTFTGIAVYAGTIGNSGAALTGTLSGAFNGPHNGTVGATTANTGAFTTITTSSTIADSIGDVRNIPQNSQVTGYTLVASDNGKHISITTGGVTVPASVFSAGNSVVVFNNSASSQTITQGASVTMYLSGTATTGNRTLAQRGLCTILCYAANSFVISGSVT